MSRKPASKRTRPKPKAVLRLPDLDQAKSAVLNSLTSADSQRGYRHAIEEFVEWYCSEPRLSFSRTVVLRYRIHLESRNLAPGTINLRLGAVRRLADEAADCGLLSPDLAAGIRRVKGVKKIGVRLGNWLTAEQSQRLWQVPDGERLKEKRDRAQMNEFFHRLHPSDRVLLVGDTRQHEAVDAGRPYKQLQDAGMQTAKLDEILRQKDPTLKEAVEQLARGDVRGGIANLEQQGRVHEIVNPQERLGAIVREYARKNGGDIGHLARQ